MHMISLKNSSNIEQPPADLPPLTDAERHQVLVEWNATRTPYPRDACIHQLFEAQVEQTPEAIAVVFEDQQLTYRELNAHANQLARFLRQYGVGPEVLVGICLERSLELVVGLLGILKAGGAYVPLDPTYPKERLAFMLEDAQVRVLVTKQPLVAALPAPRTRVVCLDVDWATIAQESAANLGSETTAEHLAYVMYTSGSTGIPKGIAVSHRAVVRLVCETNYVQLGPTDRLAQASNAAFDACCGQGKTDTKLSRSSDFFVCIGTDIPEIRMLTPTVVKHLDIVNDVITGFLTRQIITLRRALALQAAKKPLRYRIV